MRPVRPHPREGGPPRETSRDITRRSGRMNPPRMCLRTHSSPLPRAGPHGSPEHATALRGTSRSRTRIEGRGIPQDSREHSCTSIRMGRSPPARQDRRRGQVRRSVEATLFTATYESGNDARSDQSGDRTGLFVSSVVSRVEDTPPRSHESQTRNRQSRG